MKIYRLIILIPMVFFIGSCTLQESPPFLSNESAFSSLSNARSSLDGVYNGLVQYGYMAHFYHYTTDGNSGFFVSGKGNRNTHPDNLNLCSLKPLPATPSIERLWQEHYKTIGRANDIIASVTENESPQTEDELGYNDVLGHAYFIRAYNYFNLVRLWGEVPLRLEPTTVETVHMAKSREKDIYAQIISDTNMAKKLMFPVGQQRLGYPAAEAANMLLAKVYMTLATAPDDIKDPNENYWQKAYDEAKQVYGKYALLDNYGTMWTETGGNNTIENIFEVQFNDIQPSNFARLFTAANATKGKTWGRLRINAEVYDLHADTYPDDIRIAETFKSEFINQKNGKTVKVYPSTKRKNFASGFPYLYKYWEKNVNNTAGVNMKNFIIYRYADLLLMLAEISNELQNGEEFGYLQEVLDRVGLTPQPEYYTGQEGFRNAIMKEYRFELLGEGHDWFNNRRRGYDFFRNNVIVPHNTAPTYNPKIDVTLLDNDESVMHLPMPSSEINTNQEINN